MTVIDWLLDADPAIRWQVLRDFTEASPQAVAAERARVATGGWGARLLAARDPDGQWAGGAHFPGDYWAERNTGKYLHQPWTATSFSLSLLRTYGIDPQYHEVRHAIAQVRDNANWEHDGQRYFDGEVEACINGQLVANGAYFGEDVAVVVDRLLTDQLADGGWNCYTEYGSTVSSAASTINVLEGLLAFEVTTGARESVTVARHRGEQYLLERCLFRRKRTGEVIDDDWLRFAFPPYWHYDVLRALTYFADAGARPDPRVDGAVELVRSHRSPEGTWSLEHSWPGDVHFTMETAGEPSRWNTLRALRVLRWSEGR